MFSEIQELMEAIDKFKADVANSDALLSSLESLKVALEQQEAGASHLRDEMGQMRKRTESLQAGLAALRTKVDDLAKSSRRVTLLLVGVAVLEAAILAVMLI